MRGLDSPPTAAQLSEVFDRDAQFAREVLEGSSLPPVRNAARRAERSASTNAPESLLGGRRVPSSTAEDSKALSEVCLSAFAFSQLWTGMGGRLAHLALKYGFLGPVLDVFVRLV